MIDVMNSKVFVWALGVIQPAKPEEVLDYLLKVFASEKQKDFKVEIGPTLSIVLEQGLVHCVSKKNNLYSVKHAGDDFLGNKLRVLKDKERLYLLKSMRDVNFLSKGASERNMGGVSPPGRLRSSTKVSPRPEVPLSLGPLPQNQRNFWPRVYQQLGIGSKTEAPLQPINLNFYSVNTLPEIKSRSEAIFAASELIGVSSYLLRDFCNSKEKYYRKFEIAKKSSNESRVINAPRVFIKTTQYWIQDYFFYRLRQHDSCFSYRKKVSIKNNASVHLNKKFILCLDIESFFDNITKMQVISCIAKSKVNVHLAELFADIVTLNGCLPQGAPTSPIISNSHLYEFDEKIFEYCSSAGMSYSRYADDLTIGANKYDSLKTLEKVVKTELETLGLSINRKKTRIISSNSCQVITGLAINNGEIRPTRKYRKEIRALFYKADDAIDIELLPKLCGHLNYIKSFKNGDTKKNIEKYQLIIDKLKKSKNIQTF
ncbi:retron St85 family RNA-directed DNA polymerase [Paraglaciecola hydrolytica]|uniref:RNA-directed DNA polymerase n=1 Tax=Paraglaciecola hydrolytica TaxID=1799789 RepID=A0A148KL59_9ALTE|nr:retron St85 family RNA-directed DNA polymerase [Paraglaciecola hydrolytica]KXI27036.1 hypothetical protein AX660_02080 [Paraglaciecola hydrolytica]